MRKFIFLCFSPFFLTGCTLNITSTVCDTHGAATDVIDTSTSTPNEVEASPALTVPASIF
jgi:hypothetical protein